MRRFLRIRILFVLIALLLVPTLVLPFAERLRAEWERFRQPRSESFTEPQFASMETLRLLEELEQANYVQRASLGRSDWCGTVSYASPVIQVGCLFRDESNQRGGVIESADFLTEEAAAEQERFLRAMEQVESTGIPIPDEPPLMYPDEQLGYPFGSWREKLREREAILNADP